MDYFYSVPTVKVELKNIDYRKCSSKISKTEQLSVEEKAKENCERHLELEHLINPQVTNGSQILNATIETLTASSLIYSYTQVDASSGVTYQHKYSFSH